MSDIAIRVDGLSKQYRIGAKQERHRTLRDTLTDAIVSPFRRARKLLRGQAYGAAELDETIWALRDVSFEIKRGEVVGIIGRNGAGKTTLLNILSRITEPTEGQAEIRGRVGSLLEVGTGFHPELTGRENIYLNGAILGMRKAEIERKFDEIVDFAEVEKFIDTPVKHYSSGMYVRLAFAVAAHLEPEILIVDEVLAVGDAAFQRKCLGKMGDAAKEGRTVLFVSHNMAATNQLCSRAILLDEGKAVSDGNASDVIVKYLKMDSETGAERRWNDQNRAPGNERIRLHSIRIISENRMTAEVDIDKEVSFEVEFWNLSPGSRNLCVNIYLLDGMGKTVLSTANTSAANSLEDDWFDEPHPPGLFRAVCTLPANFLNDGLYYISVYLVSLGPLRVEAQALEVLSFNVNDTGVMREPGAGSRWDGVVRVRLPWRTEFVQPLTT
ncbi:MAG: ABC transporter ATP-binding protein [Planctomycetota bacterium]|jgi:lipopolysaccharide transport system ATP-binding protein